MQRMEVSPRIPYPTEVSDEERAFLVSRPMENWLWRDCGKRGAA